MAGMVGHVPSGVLWDHLPQASAGFKGQWAPGLSRLVGVCACACACASSPKCAVNQDLSTSQEERGPYHPSGPILIQEGGVGSLLPSPPAPATGASLTGVPLLQEEGFAACVKDGCTSPGEETVGAGRAVELDAEVEGPSSPCHRPEGSGHLPEALGESGRSGLGAGDSVS